MAKQLTAKQLTANQYKALLKVLVGIAWIDGEIAPEEVKYLQEMAQKLQLEHDPEIQDLLRFDRTISFQGCIGLISAYLDQDQSDGSYEALLHAIRSLIQSDGQVSGPEKAFLQISQFLQGGLENPKLAAQIRQCRDLDETIALAKSWGYEIEAETFKQARRQLGRLSRLVTVSALTIGVIAAPMMPARADTAPASSPQEQLSPTSVSLSKAEAALQAADLLDAIAGELRGAETVNSEQASGDQVSGDQARGGSETTTNQARS